MKHQQRTDNLYALIILWLLSAFLVAANANAATPSYCESPEAFKKHELTTNAPDAKRLRSFKLGKLTLTGLAVGGTDANVTASLSPAPASAKYCTWYLNQGNEQAENIFNHEYMRGPYWGWLPFNGVVKSYEQRLEKHWAGFVECAKKYNYVALGCDGHRHRGPSVFAALLTLSAFVVA